MLIKRVGCWRQFSFWPYPCWSWEYPLAEPRQSTFQNPRSYVPSCADNGSLAALAASEPVNLNLASNRGIEMFNNKETRFIEAGLLLAVPLCVALTALIAVFALAKI